MFYKYEFQICKVDVVARRQIIEQTCTNRAPIEPNCRTKNFVGDFVLKQLAINCFPPPSILNPLYNSRKHDNCVHRFVSLPGTGACTRMGTAGPSTLGKRHNGRQEQDVVATCTSAQAEEKVAYRALRGGAAYFYTYYLLIFSLLAKLTFVWPVPLH